MAAGMLPLVPGGESNLPVQVYLLLSIPLARLAIIFRLDDSMQDRIPPGYPLADATIFLLAPLQ